MKKIILYLIIAFLFSGCAAKRNFQNARQVNTIKAYEEFLANFLNENPSLKIRFEGHTDCIGTSHIKKRLSDT